MSSIKLTAALRSEYEDLFNSCVIASAKQGVVKGLVDSLVASRTRYESVGKAMGIPWAFIGVVHNMESSLSFAKHLHNGDPLTARTVQVPAGRPKTGEPPFTWEQSATDALAMKGLSADTDWSLAGILYQLEAYNGWGYRKFHPHVKSPYLWSFSNHYVAGKYVADGTWSETAVSKQCGAAVLLRRLAEVNAFNFSDQPAPSVNAKPLVVPYSKKKSADPSVVAQAEVLQRWLNTFPGVFTKIDGVPGPSTSDAFKAVTGTYLPGDPRG